MEMTVKPRKWGNSIGIAIPKHIVEKEKITLKDDLVVDIRKKKNSEEVRKFFGRFKFSQSTQQIKEDMRKGWE